MSDLRCVIVGAGHGASELCASLRSSGWEGPITVIGDEPLAPYHRPPLSKTQLDPNTEHAVQLIRPSSFYSDHTIELLTGERVTRIDRESQTVHTATHSIPYDRLVLCTGSTHITPPIEGIDHPYCFQLRTAEDAAAVRSQLAAATRCVVIGAGFIGLEVAASLRKQGLDVTVLELAPRVLARVTSPGISTYFEALHRERGVAIQTGVSVTAIREIDQHLEVVTASGATFQGDFVVLGVGAQSDSHLAEAAGIDVDNGVLVNPFNQTSDPNIYALGDCCRMRSSSLRLESVQNAVDQARTVAKALVGNPTAHDALPWFWSDQYDVKLQTAGLSAGYDQVVLRGTDTPGHAFSAWYFREGRFIAVDAVNDSIAYAVAGKLLKGDLHPDPAWIADPAIETKTLLKKAKEQAHV